MLASPLQALASDMRKSARSARVKFKLGLSQEDPLETFRHVSEVANLIADAGAVVINAFVLPNRMDRHRARPRSPSTATWTS
jgi:adenylylsulfate kinase-like enzyme